MVNFKESYNRGKHNAEAATKNKQEISDVLADLSNQLAEVTDNHVVKVEIQDRERFQPDANVFVIDIFKPFPGKMKQYTALVALGPEPDKEGGQFEMCEMSLSPQGYPVTLRYHGRSVLCRDTESFQQALAKMLEYPDIAEGINEIGTTG